ncbi:MAG: acoC [Glaciihabitans sp.]|nr:acoC [Glaciihabitans sp.]
MSEQSPTVEDTVDVAGIRARYRVSGPPGAMPVLLVHGIGRSLGDWSEQHRLLSARHRVYSLDLAGFGHSEPLAERHTLTSLADFTDRFLDVMGVGRVHLVGNSLGGAIAMQLAVGDPQRVASLVLVNSAGFGRTVTPAIRVMAIKPLGRVLLRPSARGARQLERSLFYDASFATEERVQEKVELAGRPHNARVFIEVAESLGTFRGVSPGWRRSLLERLREVNVPTYVMWGDRDLILPAQHLEAARSVMPQAQSHLFENTGHMPQIERAEEFAELVLAFWQPLERAE